MKATKRNIAICGLTVVVCASLLAGVTYAWFTDSITNSGNTISSGDLKIDATAYDLGEDGKSYEINGKNYTFEAEGQNLKTDNKAVIAETNWYPGQSSAKLFTVENVGSLDAAVSLDFFVSGGLTNALWFDFIQVGEDGRILGNFGERDMETLPELANQLGDVKLASKASMSFVLVYGMEEEAQNEYMNKSFQVNVFISAKQTVEGAEGPIVVNPGTDLSEVIEEVSDNSTIVLAANSEYEVKNPIDLSGKKGIVIDGNGATITMNESIEGASFLSFAAMRANAETRTNYQKSIIRVEGASDVIIRNLTIEGSESHGINVYDCSNVTIEDVNINNSAELAICVNGSDVSLVNVHTSGSGWGAVNLDLGTKGTSSLTVDADCQFEEYLQIYADSTTVADKVSVNAAGYNRYNVVATDGNNRVLWTNNENVVEGAVFVDDAEGLASAVAAGGNVILANDIKATLNGASVTNALSLNLNNYTLTSNGTTFPEGASVVITNGVIDMRNSTTPFCLRSNSQLEMSYLNVTSDYTVALVGNSEFKGENSKLVVDHCNFTVCDSAAITTNANKQPWSCEIVVTNSTITCDSTNHKDWPMDNCPIYMNVDGNLTIDNCTITGQRQGVMVRTGNAKITNTTIIDTCEYYDLDSADLHLNGNWGSGNEVPMAALVVGNRGNAGNAYEHPTNVTVENCTLISENKEVPAMYIWGNTTEETKVVLTFDKATYDNMQGDIAGVLESTENSKVEINTPEGIVVNASQLKAALANGGDVILAADVVIDPVGEGNENIPLIPQIIVTKNATLNLNGKTISLNQEPCAASFNYVIGLISVMNNATLTVNGDGVIDAEAQYNTAYGFNVYGGKLVINGGTYYGAMSAVQVQIGEVEINGGHFELAKTIAADAPQYSNYLINCIDANIKNGTATIVVNGGSFVGYNPGASYGEPDAPISFIDKDTYKVEVSGEGHTAIYTVVPVTEDAE